MTHTSLGVMWTAVPRWFADDTEAVLSGDLGEASGVPNPWIDSPIFDRLAGERFGTSLDIPPATR